MNLIISKNLSRLLCAGAIFLGAGAATADTIVTFQIDMTSEINASSFTPGSGTITANGSFNGWSALTLTNNPGGANPNLYSGTVDDTSDANGGIMQYKFVMNGNYESGSANNSGGNNRCYLLPKVSGSQVTIPAATFQDSGAPTNQVITFQVDMSEQMNLGAFNPGTGSTVEVHGTFDGWGGAVTLTNNPAVLTTNAQGIVSSNVYVAVITEDLAPGGYENFKYVMQPGSSWESPGPADADPSSGNRFYDNATQTLPVVSFNDIPYTQTVTNNVTFEIDMTVQLEEGGFTNGTSSVEIHGDFNGWGSGVTMTNNPSSPTPNIYSTVVNFVSAAGQEHYFKYVMQPGTQWENVSAANSSGGNRYLYMPNTNGNFVDGPVYFSDIGPSSLIDLVTVSNCMVTFTVNMTNAVGTDGATFTPGSDVVYINGLNNGIANDFWTWGVLSAPSAYQMNQIGSSALYTITLPVNQGQPLDLPYKYSINGNDDEAGFADNHNRYIRSLPDYTMPVDVFDSQGSGNQAEPSFGNLTIAPLGAHKVSVSWLGRTGVYLQTTPALKSSGTVFTPQPLTDGTNLIVAPGGIATTNYTITPGNLFFELVGPQ